MQFKPKRKKKDGSYTDKESMSNATKRYWKEKKERKDDSSQPEETSQKTTSIDYYDSEGVQNTGNSQSQRKRPRRQKDKDGWDGKTYDKNKTDWGKSYNDDQYEKGDDENATKAESGYGKPSKGQYSSDLGGFKSFGTIGQGDSSLGAKDTNDTTCGDRVILLTITATQDTSDAADSSSTTSSSSHPVVQSSGSKYMTFEVGSY